MGGNRRPQVDPQHRLDLRHLGRADGFPAQTALHHGAADTEIQDLPQLVEVVEGFDASAEVSRDGLSASGDSIMGLLMLAASRGTTVDIETSGPDAEALADAIEALIADRFGEDD